jgi:hypothetical protein
MQIDYTKSVAAAPRPFVHHHHLTGSLRQADATRVTMQTTRCDITHAVAMIRPKPMA